MDSRTGKENRTVRVRVSESAPLSPPMSSASLRRTSTCRRRGGVRVENVRDYAASGLALLPRPPGRLASRPPRDVDWSRVTAPRVASVATASAPATGSSFLPPSASSLHQNPPSALTKPLRFANQTFTTLAFCMTLGMGFTRTGQRLSNSTKRRPCEDML